MFLKRAMAAGLMSAAMALGSGAASAATVDLTFLGLDVKPAQTVKITSPTNTGTVYAGGFRMADESGSEFLAWCIDIFQSIKSAEYDMTQPAEVSADEANALSRLFTSHRAGAQTNALTAAAFQLAIWEIVYEDTTDTDGNIVYDVRTGRFDAQNNYDALNAANTLLATMGDVAAYKLSFFESDHSQDLVVGTVPLPASLALMLGGLGMLGVARRRRAQS